MKKIFFLSFVFCLFTFKTFGVEKHLPPSQREKSKNNSQIFNYFKDKDFQFVPVPVFETGPDRGQSYGVMPIILVSKKGENEIQALLGVIAQYNTIMKFDMAGLAYFYPSLDQELEIFVEVAQKVNREFSLHYLNSKLKDKFFLDGTAGYYQSPFTRFFGLGPDTSEGNETNYVNHATLFDLTGGYFLTPTLRVNFTPRVHNVNLKNRAIKDVADTLTTFAGNPAVHDAFTFIQEYSLVFDNRPEGIYSTKGMSLQGAYFFSRTELGSDQNFQGIKFDAIHLYPLIKNRLTTALRLNYQQVFGGNDIPFYELNALGGANELRSFFTQRFIDKGRVLFQAEARIKLVDWRLFGKSFSIYTDPFFDLGSVFENPGSFQFNDLQPTGGAGFRLVVPPNIVGRVDFAMGSDGFNVYTALGYPF